MSHTPWTPTAPAIGASPAGRPNLLCDLTAEQVAAVLADVGTQPSAHLPVTAVEAPAYSTPVPYMPPGIAPVQQLLLPDGRVVTGYALTPPVTPVPAPAQQGPRIDPGAQRLVGAGVFALCVGAGGALLLSAVAAAATGLTALAVCIVAVWAMRGHGGTGGGGVRVDVRVAPTITTSSRARGR